MAMKTYSSPETEIFEIGPGRDVCLSDGGTSLRGNYGSGGAAGGGIENDNIVDGGEY